MAVAQVGRQQGSGLGANAVQAEGDESAAKVNAETVGNASEHDEDVEEAIRVELEGVSIANEEEDADFANAEEAVEDAEESDEGGWITPTNVRRVKQRHYNGASGDKGEAQTMDVACVTTDFAMQVGREQCIASIVELHTRTCSLYHRTSYCKWA